MYYMFKYKITLTQYLPPTPITIGPAYDNLYIWDDFFVVFVVRMDVLELPLSVFVTMSSDESCSA